MAPGARVQRIGKVFHGFGDRDADLKQAKSIIAARIIAVTPVTNAVIERRGAQTGMLVTAGFRNILDMGFEQRYDLFDLRLTWPDSLAPRRLRREVPERVCAGGTDGLESPRTSRSLEKRRHDS